MSGILCSRVAFGSRGCGGEPKTGGDCSLSVVGSVLGARPLGGCRGGYAGEAVVDQPAWMPQSRWRVPRG